MSVAAITWAWEQPVSRLVDRALLVALADFADDKHRCFPSQATLAQRCLCSVDTIQRALKRLEAGGFIVRSKRGSEHGGGVSDLFTLTVAVTVGLSRKERPQVKPQHVRCKGEVVKPQNAAGVKPHSCAEVKPHSCAVGTVTEPSEGVGEEDRLPNTTTVEAAATLPAAAPNFEQTSEPSDYQTLEQDAARIGIKPRPLAACVNSYGHSVAKAAVTRIAGKENIRNPNARLGRIREDGVADRQRGRREDAVPIGAIDLGGGHYVARWGSR